MPSNALSTQRRRLLIDNRISNSNEISGNDIFSVFRRFLLLEVLNFRDNALKTVPNNAFDQQKHLYKVILEINNIARIGDDAFANLESLRSVTLQDNKLRTFGYAIPYQPRHSLP